MESRLLYSSIFDLFALAFSRTKSCGGGLACGLIAPLNRAPFLIRVHSTILCSFMLFCYRRLGPRGNLFQLS